MPQLMPSFISPGHLHTCTCTRSMKFPCRHYGVFLLEIASAGDAVTKRLRREKIISTVVE